VPYVGVITTVTFHDAAAATTRPTSSQSSTGVSPVTDQLK